MTTARRQVLSPTNILDRMEAEARQEGLDIDYRSGRHRTPESAEREREMAKAQGGYYPGDKPTTHREPTVADLDRERPGDDYDRGDVDREFAIGGPCRPGTPKRDAAACRVASERERELLKRYGSPVPIGEQPKPDAGPIRLPIDDTPPPSPPRPAAVRPLLIPRAETAPIESASQSMYPHLTDDARLLIRLLDTAAHGRSVPPFWSVAFIDLVHAFTAEGDDRWEPEVRVWKAIHEIKRWDLAEIIPGQHRGMAAIFLSEHPHREMLAARVLHTPHSIPLCRIPDAAILNAKASLAA